MLFDLNVTTFLNSCSCLPVLVIKSSYFKSRCSSLALSHHDNNYYIIVNCLKLISFQSEFFLSNLLNYKTGIGEQ